MTPENMGKVQRLSESVLSFGPFRIEAVKHLWRGDHRIDLRLKSLALLRYLAERPGKLIAKEELRTRLWPGIYVSSIVVKVCVQEIRSALGDDAKQSQFIETVGAQGYRFIAPVGIASSVLSSEPQDQDQHSIPDDWQRTALFVGREAELTQLQAGYASVQQGKQQIMFVSGEAGIGKTTVVERFLSNALAGGAVRIGRGYCVEQASQGETYLPVLQALQQLCRAPDGGQVVAILRRYAPLWLLQLSGVLEADERERLQRQVQDCSPQRMVRELAQALKELTTESAVILFFDDLQWSAVSTLELMAYLAQLREQTRLLMIGSYRPTDVVLSGHPLRRVLQSLIGRGQAQELTLELFTAGEIQAYLTQRLAGSPVANILSPVIHRRTEGNVLFVKHFVDYLLQQGLLAKANGRWALRTEPAMVEELMPDHVHRLLVAEIEGLSREEQQLLGVASVAGLTFTAGEVAAILNRPLSATEAVYDELANQGRFVEVQGLAEWPDGSVTVRYRFRHALYQQALYQHVGLAQRVRWQRQLGEHFAIMAAERPQKIEDC